jgi:hypothetical protein
MRTRAILLSGSLLLAACGANSRAQELLVAGDWAGARNVLVQDLPGGDGALDDRALLLFAHAVPDLLGRDGGSWFLEACVLDEQATRYALQPSPDEESRLARLRNDRRRILTDKGISTADPHEYGELLRATVRYGLDEHPWQAEHLLAQGALGLCGVWLQVEGAEEALLAPLASRSALSRGADRYLSLAGDRMVEPLRALAADPAEVASGPASDILRDMLRPAAERSVLGAVEEPQHPFERVRVVVSNEGVGSPPFSAAAPSDPATSAQDRLRDWFRLDVNDATRLRTQAWAAHVLEVDGRQVRLFWTWDSQDAAHRLYGLAWAGTEWQRLSFDGQDPHSHTSQVVLGVGRATGEGAGDLTLRVFDGVAEQVENVETWAGTVQKKHRAARVLERSMRLEGSALVMAAETEGS